GRTGVFVLPSTTVPPIVFVGVSSEFVAASVFAEVLASENATGVSAARPATAPRTASRERFMSSIEHERRSEVAPEQPKRGYETRRAGPDQGRGLHLLDVDRLRPLRALLLLVGDLRALRERAVAVARDAAEMDEQVTPAIVGCDEAEALVVAEPLDGSGCHATPLLCFRITRRPGRRRNRGKPTRGDRERCLAER